MRLLQWSNVESILFSNSWPSYVPISRWCRRPPPFKSFLARHQAPLNLSASFVSNVVFDAHETSFRAQFYNPPSPPSFSLSLVPKCRARSLVSSSPPFSPDCPFQPPPPSRIGREMHLTNVWKSSNVYLYMRNSPFVTFKRKKLCVGDIVRSVEESIRSFFWNPVYTTT